jgi:hypothetical protein
VLCVTDIITYFGLLGRTHTNTIVEIILCRIASRYHCNTDDFETPNQCNSAVPGELPVQHNLTSVLLELCCFCCKGIKICMSPLLS